MWEGPQGELTAPINRPSIMKLKAKSQASFNPSNGASHSESVVTSLRAKSKMSFTGNPERVVTSL